MILTKLLYQNIVNIMMKCQVISLVNLNAIVRTDFSINNIINK